MHNSPTGMGVFSLTWSVHKTKMSLKALQAWPRRPWMLRNTLHRCEHIGNHQEFGEGWSDASEGPGSARRTARGSRRCSWLGLCRTRLLGVKGLRKHKWEVGEHLSSNCNSKTTQETVAVENVDVQRWECPNKQVSRKSKPRRPSKSRLIPSLHVLESAVTMRFLQLQQ